LQKFTYMSNLNYRNSTDSTHQLGVYKSGDKYIMKKKGGGGGTNSEEGAMVNGA